MDATIRPSMGLFVDGNDGIMTSHAQASFRRLFLALLIAWMMLYADILFLGWRLPFDAMDQFYPTVYFNAHALRSGAWPWWNPYIYAGYAQIGDPQGMLFSPLLMGWMLLRADPGSGWFAWGVLLHLLMGGTAMLYLLRRCGANSLGILIGTIVFMAGGVASSRLEHVPDVIAYAYVPVVLAAFRWLLDRPGAMRGVLPGLAAGAMVTQLVQITYLFALVIAAYVVQASWRQWTTLDVRRRWALLRGLVVASVVAALIGMPQLAFTWATVGLSSRNDLPLSAADAGSLDFRAFLFLVNPNAFDALRDLTRVPFDALSAFIYIGIIPLLSILGLRRAWNEGVGRRAIACFAGLAVVATVYMLGTRTPVYGWLYGWMPGLSYFRRPSDAAYLFNFAMAFLVGIAASGIGLNSRKRILILLSITMAWLVALSVRLYDLHGDSIVAVVVVAIALWDLRRPSREWHAVLWLVAVLVFDYRAFNLNGSFSNGKDDASAFVKSPAVRYLASNASYRIDTSDTPMAWDNTVMLAGLSSTQGYNPLRYALYDERYRPRESGMASPRADVDRKGTYDALLGVRYLVMGHRHGGASPSPGGFRKTLALGDVDIWEADKVYSRFLGPTHVNVLAVGEMPDPDSFSRTDFESTVWMTPRDDEDLRQVRELGSSCGGKVRSTPVGSTLTRTDIQTESPSMGWVVVGDLDHPGWVAEVDGVSVPIHRANGMFRAVCVAAGSHRLSFVFRPWRMVVTAWRGRGSSIAMESS